MSYLVLEFFPNKLRIVLAFANSDWYDENASMIIPICHHLLFQHLLHWLLSVQLEQTTSEKLIKSTKEKNQILLSYLHVFVHPIVRNYIHLQRLVHQQ